MTDAHHNAAKRHQRRGSETKLFGPQQRGDGHIPPRLELAIGLHRDAAAQVVEHEGLMRFGHPQFPGQTGMFDAGQRRSARAAIVTADQDHVGVTFGHTGRNRAHADFRNQLDADAGPLVGILQIVDQFGQIFNRVNVMVRRRRNQAHAGRRMAHLGDPGINLGARQLTALARLGPLGHLDLQFPRLDQIVGWSRQSGRRPPA